MRKPILPLLLCICAGVALCGCRRFMNEPLDGSGKTLLPPLQLGEDCVALELFFVRIPATQSDQEGQLWNEVDEQQMPLSARRQWQANGLRVGFVSGQLPPSLSKLLAPQDGAKDPAKTLLAEDPRPAVTRRVIHTHTARRNEVLLSPTLPEMNILISEEGQLRGRTYENSAAQFGLKVFPLGDGRAKLDFTPELQYGDARPRYIGEDGVMRLDASRPRQAFEKLMVESTLSEGQLLVFGHFSDRPGSLGYHLFTEEKDGQRERKLLLVRMGRPQRDDLFTTDISAAAEKE